MKPIKQAKHNDCLSACIASILEVPLEDVPNTIEDYEYEDAPHWFFGLNDDLRERFGYELYIVESTPKGNFPRVCLDTHNYWIGQVPSLNLKGKYHAIVMRGNRIEFDPAGGNGYPVGKSMSELHMVSIGVLIPAYPERAVVI